MLAYPLTNPTNLSLAACEEKDGRRNREIKIKKKIVEKNKHGPVEIRVEKDPTQLDIRGFSKGAELGQVSLDCRIIVLQLMASNNAPTNSK